MPSAEPPASVESTTPPRSSTDGRRAATREPDAHDARRARVVIALLAAAILWACVPFLAGLLGAGVLASIASPCHRRLAHWGTKRAALLITLAAALLLVAPAAWLLIVMVPQAPGALQRIAESDAFNRVASVQVGHLDVGAQLAKAGESAVIWGSQHVMSIAGSATRALLNLVLSLVGLYYLLVGGAALWLQVRPLIPFSGEGADMLRERFSSLTQATLLGIAAAAASQGAIVGVAFWLVDLPNPLTWGAVTAGVSILPILGSAIVWAPATVLLVAEARIGAAITLGLIGVIFASNIDNVVRPFVYRRVSGLHPMLTLVGAFAGVRIFGLLGLLLGPLALAYGVELLRLYQSEYVHGTSPRRQPPVDDTVAPVFAPASWRR